MRLLAAVSLALVCSACATALLPAPELAPLWRPVAAPGAPEALRVEPLHSAARLGDAAKLRVLGELASGATCQLSDGEPLALAAGGALAVASPAVPAPVEVVCTSGELRASAQVTFSDSRSLPVADPYQGAVVLFKLRELPQPFAGAAGRSALGLHALDAKLRALGALALPAFPFDRTGTRDAVGLGLWVAIDLPEDVNYYQAVSWLRSDPSIHAESYLPEDAAFLRVRARGEWPAGFAAVTRIEDPDAEGYRAAVRQTTSKRVAVSDAGEDLRAIGAPQVWSEGQGEAVRLALVDTGVDVNHATIAKNLLDKSSERDGDDLDGNGVPGDRFGTNLAHLAIARDADGGARLALGVARDLSDWDGAAAPPRRDWGHGTAIASIAAGAGGLGLRLGVAPRAQLIAVDVQENLRTSLTEGVDDDPRMQPGERSPASLRSSTWARAAGVVYAVGERARVITCAWPGDRPHWLLHDALLYAEDNCAIPICSTGAGPDSVGPYPGHWRESWLEKHGGGAGVVYDPWTDAESSDAILRPLRGLVVTDQSATSEGAPDLVLPLVAGRPLELAGAVSNPRNDASRVPDRRQAPVSGSVAAVGLGAGAAVLVTGVRPDLEPFQIRDALVDGAAKSPAGPALSVPGALAATGQLDTGACRALLRRVPTEEASPWPKWKIKANTPGPFDDEKPKPPASPERER